MQVTMTVNGESVTREIEGRLLLVHFLRDELGLTGTHWGCDTSNCGTCVAWMDGEPVKTCTVLAAMAGGREVRTVEGLETGRRARPGPGGVHAVPRPAVRVLHAGHADDRPGAARPRPATRARHTIREAISGQICRCTGYTTIVRSIQWAAEHRRPRPRRPSAAAETVGSAS